METSKKQREESLQWLRNYIKPGQAIYTNLIHVSASGMSRTISAHIVLNDKSIFNISADVSRVIDAPRDHKRGGCKMTGCGMDMGFELVYCLGRAMFPNGGPVQKSMRRSQEERAGKTHETDGGYLLRQVWL